jgi:hypothetical protein
VGREGNFEIFFNCVDDECEGKIIQKSVVVFMELKWVINKNIVWLFERHKSSPRPNTTISTMVMAVTSGKHSEHGTEQCVS